MLKAVELDFENHVTFHKLVSWQVFLVCNLEGNSHSNHFLGNCIPPIGITVFLVNPKNLFDGLRYLKAKLMSLLVVVLVHSSNNVVPTLEYTRHPPGKSRFICDSLDIGIFSIINWVGLFQFGKSFPQCAAIFPLHTQMPSLGAPLTLSVTATP